MVPCTGDEPGHEVLSDICKVFLRATELKGSAEGAQNQLFLKHFISVATVV